MADLEEHAVRRDRKFLIRLILCLVLGTVFGLFLFGRLTSHEFGGCAARGFGTLTGGGSSGDKPSAP